MTDTRIRELERRAKTTGDAIDIARVIEAKLQAGIECRQCPQCHACDGRGEYWGGRDNIERFVTCHKCKGQLFCVSCAGLSYQSRVELAAYCGDKAARLVLNRPLRLDRNTYDTKRWSCVCLPAQCYEQCNGYGSERVCKKPARCCAPCMCLGDAMAHDGIEGPLNMSFFARGLTNWGQVVTIRAAVAASCVTLAIWEANAKKDGWWNDAEDRDLPKRGLNAATRWLNGFARKDAEECLRIHDIMYGIRVPTEPWAFAMSCVILASHTDLGPPEDCDDHIHALTHAARIATEPTIRDAIREVLVPWCLA